MYKIESSFEFEAAHRLNLDYESKCKNLHGHTYKCAITVTGNQINTLDRNGMICDFTILKQVIKEKIEDRLDHAYLNDIFEVNATAEYMSKWICDNINEGLKEKNIDARCIKVSLNETSKNRAIWEED